MGNDEKRKFGLRWRDRKKSASATVEYLDMKAVPEGWIYCVQQVAVNNETDSYTHLYIGTRSGATYKSIEDTPSPAADQFYTWQGELFLHPGEIFSVKFVGATADDVLEALAWGWRQKIR
uniref:Uncharacterized protein n=1 Tax=viral metagenome TaxID=1070528 RepID=A0A6H2A1F2_9ZZZZ